MPRDTIARTRSKPASEAEPSGLDEFKKPENSGRERITKDVPYSSFGAGWSTSKKTPKFRSSRDAKRFEQEIPDDGEEILFKFLEEVPFASYWQHWVKKRPYVCLIDDCPLCEIGHRPKSVDCFNVIALHKVNTTGEVIPEVFLWSLSPAPKKEVEAKAEKPRSSPLNREDLYFTISKKMGKNKIPEFNLEFIKADELEEEYGMPPLTAEAIESLAETSFGEVDLTQVSTRQELEDVVSSLED